ncbi:MAG: heavy metal-binding domain-containing protein [Elusimicrobiota bacterium]
MKTVGALFVTFILATGTTYAMSCHGTGGNTTQENEPSRYTSEQAPLAIPHHEIEKDTSTIVIIDKSTSTTELKQDTSTVVGTLPLVHKTKVNITATKTVYICPMGEYEGNKPGKCPKCGMKLKKLVRVK